MISDIWNSPRQNSSFVFETLLTNKRHIMIKPTQKSAQKKQGSIQLVKATETRSLPRDLQLQKQDYVWTVLYAVLRIQTLAKNNENWFTFQKFIWNVCTQGQVQIHRWTVMCKSGAHTMDYLKTIWSNQNQAFS